MIKVSYTPRPTDRVDDRPRCAIEISKEMDPSDYEYRRNRATRNPSKYPEPFWQCVRPSTYIINGEHLCTQHAGMQALKVLTEDHYQVRSVPQTNMQLNYTIVEDEIGENLYQWKPWYIRSIDWMRRRK